MKAIESALWPPEILRYLSGVTNSTSRASSSIGENKHGYVLVHSTDLQYCTPKPITSYNELRSLVAQLAALNPQYELYFRGQDKIYRKTCYLKSRGNPRFSIGTLRSEYGIESGHADARPAGSVP